jgi:hypothetical protein
VRIVTNATVSGAFTAGIAAAIVAITDWRCLVRH